jgi:hypothetical protein
VLQRREGGKAAAPVDDEAEEKPAPKSHYAKFLEAIRARTDATCRKALEKDIQRRERRRRRRWSRSRSRRRRRDDEDSYSSSSRPSFDELNEEAEAEVFRLARGLPAGLASLSRRIAGGLLKATLIKMRGYLETRRAAGGDHENEIAALCSVYLRTVQIPLPLPRSATPSGADNCWLDGHAKPPAGGRGMPVGVCDCGQGRHVDLELVTWCGGFSLGVVGRRGLLSVRQHQR